MSTPAPLPLIPDVYVSMVASVCATCRHWGESDGGDGGKCEVIDRELFGDARGDDRGLYTRANFGCRLHEAKGK